MKNVADVYLQNMIETASPITQIIMLYDKAIECMDKAIELYDLREDLEKRKEFVENIDKVYDIVSALKSFLDLEKGQEIAKNLNQIYTVILSTLVKVDKKKDELIKIAEIFRDLRDAWQYVKRTKVLS